MNVCKAVVPEKMVGCLSSLRIANKKMRLKLRTSVITKHDDRIKAVRRRNYLKIRGNVTKSESQPGPAIITTTRSDIYILILLKDLDSFVEI